MKRRLHTALAAISLSLSLIGCGGGAHLSDHFGDKTRAAFASQHVAAEPSPNWAEKTPAGLDSEEAAIIHERYRRSIGAAPGKRADPGSTVLIVQEPQDGPRR